MSAPLSVSNSWSCQGLGSRSDIDALHVPSSIASEGFTERLLATVDAPGAIWRLISRLVRCKLAKQSHDAPPQLRVFNSHERLRECQPIRRRQEGEDV